MNYYDPERLVSAASLYEWYGPSAKIELPDDIRAVIAEMKETLSELPKSKLRDGLSNTLGRVGTETLRDKILRQLSEVLDVLDKLDTFDRGHAERVISYSVKCRNALVHGSEKKKIFRVLESHQSLMIDTLEVLFAFQCLYTSDWQLHREDERYLRGYSRYGNFIRGFNSRVAQFITDVQ